VWKIILYRPEALLCATFAALIIAGAAGLALPIAHAPGQWVAPLDALFTATSAVCVTGLITVDTPVAFSRTGLTLILLLIQLGGLGIMTFTALAAQIFRWKLSFSSHVAWQSTFFDSETRLDLHRSVRVILLATFAFETGGTLLIWRGLPRDDTAGGLFEAMFHAVSAFCNAGFSVRSANAMAYRDAPLILFTLMALITLGGLGYTVLLESLQRCWRWIRRRRDGAVLWTLHARIVLVTSAILSFGGAVVLAAFGLTPSEDSVGARLLHGLFQSVSARTAGFNSVDIGALPLPALLILIALMFVGGSPGSCAGGIKTTCAAVWSARIRARLAGRSEVTLFERRIPHEIVRRAALVISVVTLWNLVGILLLALSESGHHPALRLEQLIFEQISAFATCGLSANAGATVSLSAEFTPIGKLWIIATMYLGRVGPLTLALAVLKPPRQLYAYPSERVMIG
jgi:trk system potassium uptake protein TrkH